MKKQTNLPAGRKLSLNKKTIAHLTATEMSNKIGGSWHSDCLPGGAKTRNGMTCPGHKTC